MASHVNSVVRGCFFQLRQLRSVPRSLTCHAKKVIVYANGRKRDRLLQLTSVRGRRNVFFIPCRLYWMQLLDSLSALFVASILRWFFVSSTGFLFDNGFMYKMVVFAFHCMYPSVCPNVSLWDVHIHGWCSCTMSPEVRTPRPGLCTAFFHETVWALQIPLSWPGSLEQFAVWTEEQNKLHCRCLDGNWGHFCRRSHIAPMRLG